LNPLTPFGPTSIAFSITGVILAWALFRQHFLDIAPIARTVVLEKIGDGVVVLDKQHRIIDANPASYDLFCKRCESTSQLIGKEIEEVISVWPEGNIHLEIDNEARTQIELMVNDEHRFYNVTSTSIANEQHEFIGWVIIFNDITIVKQANECLQGQLDEIRKLQALLQVQVIRDSLTGCYNRHYLNEILLRESSRAKRKDETIGLMMLDIDHFKRVNDTYGHINGDRILQSLGENLRQWVRAEDMVFRYGGEEFLIVFPDIPFAPFVERAEALCKQIADWQFPIKPKTNLTVTVSVGVALFPVHQKDIYQVLECADQALYRAKRVGRNTVSVWNAADEQTTSTTENCGE
jgi:diguanylate cyclase (GGDEF) domain